MLLIHSVYVIESFYRDYRSVNNRFIPLHQTFREELADQLVGVFRSERKHTGRPSDMYVTEARLQNVGLHHPSVDVCRDCALCKKNVKALHPGGVIPRGLSQHTLGIRRSNIKFEQCNV